MEVVWSNQASEGEQIDQSWQEEILPGEAALLEIVRGRDVTKDPERICIHCLHSFANRENRNRHSEKCRDGMINPNAGVVQKDYACIRCGKLYVNQGNLLKHMESCNGVMHHIAPVDIQEPEGREVEIYTISTDASNDMETDHPMSQLPNASAGETATEGGHRIHTSTQYKTPEQMDPQSGHAMEK